jgi:hypothetical protein
MIEFGLLVVEKIYKIFQCNYPLRLNKLESPSPKDGLCKVWLKLAQLFWRRRFLNDSTTFLYFCDYLPFEEDLAL